MRQDKIRETSVRGLAGRALLAALAVVAGASLLAGCQGIGEGETAVEVPAQRVESPALGVAIANLPPVFQVVVNEEDRLELAPTDATLGGRLLVVAGEPPEIGGVNLVAAVQAHKEDILARPDGEYQGQRELAGLPLGKSFYSRGRYSAEGGGTEEETVVYFLHPWGDRPLLLIYRYPAGEDTPSRLQDQLFEVALELEPLEGSMPPGAESEGKDGTPTEGG